MQFYITKKPFLKNIPAHYQWERNPQMVSAQLPPAQLDSKKVQVTYVPKPPLHKLSQVSHLICAIRITLASPSPAPRWAPASIHLVVRSGRSVEPIRGPFPVLNGFYSSVSYTSLKYLKNTHTLASEPSSNSDMATF